MGDKNNNKTKTDATITTSELPIQDIRGEAPMKNIPLSSLPSFQRMTVEDPNTFLFEFNVLCMSYDYVSDAQKLELFPTTLKGATLRWFMGLGSTSIRTWSDTKETFLSKYQDYCRTRDLGEEVFRMTQKEDESLEDYVEKFHYNLQRSKHTDLDHEILKTIFIRGMRDDCLDTLNLLGKREISQEPLAKNINICLRCYRGLSKGRSTIQDASARIQKSTSGGVTRAEIENLFENFKTDILNTLSSQIMTTHIKKSQGEVDSPLGLFCINCWKKHPLRECEMNNISLCNICELEHSTDQCRSFLD